MQRFLFARVEVWVLCVLFFVGTLALIAFGGLVLLRERGSSFAGAAGQAAHSLAEMPLVVRQLLKSDPRIYTNAARFDDIRSGWSAVDGASARPLTGYLLLSRLDGDRQRQVIELVDLSDMSIRHTWLPDADRLLEGIEDPQFDEQRQNWTLTHFRAIHPFAYPDGSLVIKDHYSPLVRIDACSEPLWMNSSHAFSHSAEADENGELWVPAHSTPQPESRWPKTFRLDSLARVTADGEIVDLVELQETLVKHGKLPLLFPVSGYSDDPLHINDIQPVLKDGPYWRKGDLFLSLRGPSLVLLFRPSSGEIMWMQSGPWLQQHDVDILDDHRISVFSNNVRDYGTGPRVEDAVEFMIYDFSTGEVSSPWQDTFMVHDIETTFEGLAELLPDGVLMVEETLSGRLLFLGEDGEILAQFLNRASDGSVYQMSWSRYIARTVGDTLVAVLEKVDCNE